MAGGSKIELPAVGHDLRHQMIVVIREILHDH